MANGPAVAAAVSGPPTLSGTRAGGLILSRFQLSLAFEPDPGFEAYIDIKSKELYLGCPVEAVVLHAMGDFDSATYEEEEWGATASSFDDSTYAGSESGLEEGETIIALKSPRPPKTAVVTGPTALQQTPTASMHIEDSSLQEPIESMPQSIINPDVTKSDAVEGSVGAGGTDAVSERGAAAKAITGPQGGASQAIEGTQGGVDQTQSSGGGGGCDGGDDGDEHMTMLLQLQALYQLVQEDEHKPESQEATVAVAAVPVVLLQQEQQQQQQLRASRASQATLEQSQSSSEDQVPPREQLAEKQQQHLALSPPVPQQDKELHQDESKPVLPTMATRQLESPGDTQQKQPQPQPVAQPVEARRTLTAVGSTTQGIAVRQIVYMSGE